MNDQCVFSQYNTVYERLHDNAVVYQLVFVIDLRKQNQLLYNNEIASLKKNGEQSYQDPSLKKNGEQSYQDLAVGRYNIYFL